MKAEIKAKIMKFGSIFNSFESTNNVSVWIETKVGGVGMCNWPMRHSRHAHLARELSVFDVPTNPIKC